MENFSFGEGVSLSLDELLLTQANRPPFLFMDAAFDVIPNKQAGSTFHFKDEWELFGVHFPSAPMVPATIMLEMMMQTAALATLLPFRLRSLSSEPPLVYLTKVINSKFSKKIAPDDTVKVLTTISWLKGSYGTAKCKIVDSSLSKNISSADVHFYCDFITGV